MKVISKSEMRAPGLVVELESTRLTEDEGAVVYVRDYASLWCLIRTDGIPVAVRIFDVESDLSVSTVDILKAEATGLAWLPPHIEALSVQSLEPRDLTIVICTRGRPDGLQRLLDSLRNQDATGFEILVVDNAPTSRTTKEVVEQSCLPRIRYVVEPARGLSRARNTGLANVSTELVGWLDDDEVADPGWVTAVMNGFRHESGAVAVCGLMLPAELRTYAQVLFEQYGGFNKGRQLTPVVLRRGSSTLVSPLFPLPSFGAGGNMAFRTQALRDLKGFDPLLGAGTGTHGGEETQVFARLLSGDSAVLFWPPSITWHYHRASLSELERQFFGYSAGLSAFYASMVRVHWRTGFELIAVLPHLFNEFRSRKRAKEGDVLPVDFPASLTRASAKGLAQGAFLYLRDWFLVSARSGLRSWSRWQNR